MFIRKKKVTLKDIKESLPKEYVLIDITNFPIITVQHNCGKNNVVDYKNIHTLQCNCEEKIREVKREKYNNALTYKEIIERENEIKRREKEETVRESIRLFTSVYERRKYEIVSREILGVIIECHKKNKTVTTYVHCRHTYGNGLSKEGYIDLAYFKEYEDYVMNPYYKACIVPELKNFDVLTHLVFRYNTKFVKKIKTGYYGIRPFHVFCDNKQIKIVLKTIKGNLKIVNFTKYINEAYAISNEMRIEVYKQNKIDSFPNTSYYETFIIDKVVVNEYLKSLNIGFEKEFDTTIIKRGI